jgi:hypothetical protein
MEELDINGDNFNTIYADIKERYLSRTSFPKIIVGTGLSISLGVAGMVGLSDELEKNFNNEYSDYLEKWNEYQADVRSNGLEAALLKIKPDEVDFVEKIREITAEYILSSDLAAREGILGRESGFEKLIRYLSETVSVQNRIIDIMTPNYDLVIETIADKLELLTNLGFEGNIFQYFNEDRIRNPRNYYSNSVPMIRLLKPHGSINWINGESSVKQINDVGYLKRNKGDIEIITPGGMKYQYGMTHELFRIHREVFNELITARNTDFSIFIYGYGFNDEHFNSVLDSKTKNIIILTRDIKQEIVDKAMSNDNWTLIYKGVSGDNLSYSHSYMIYKKQKYKLSTELWNIDVFADIFIG